MPRSFSHLPWKQSFRRLPPEIENALESFPAETMCVVGCAKVLSASEVAAGHYRHLYIDDLSDVREEFESLIPSPNVGPTSFANSTTIERADKKRGKHTKLIHGRAPTRGRFSSHPTAYRREVWHRTFHPPGMSHIAYKRLPGGSDDKHVPVHFQIQEVVNTSSPDCATSLLRCVNLLQENGGRVDLLRLAEAEADSIPHDARKDALRKVLRVATPSLLGTNRLFHALLRDGVPVEYQHKDGSIAGDAVRLIDLGALDANDWFAVNQFTVVEGSTNRRPDVVGAETR
jgi:hypothetical protein